MSQNGFVGWSEDRAKRDSGFGIPPGGGPVAVGLSPPDVAQVGIAAPAVRIVGASLTQRILQIRVIVNGAVGYVFARECASRLSREVYPFRGKFTGLAVEAVVVPVASCHAEEVQHVVAPFPKVDEGDGTAVLRDIVVGIRRVDFHHSQSVGFAEDNRAAGSLGVLPAFVDDHGGVSGRVLGPDGRRIALRRVVTVPEVGNKLPALGEELHDQSIEVPVLRGGASVVERDGGCLLAFARPQQGQTIATHQSAGDGEFAVFGLSCAVRGDAHWVVQKLINPSPSASATPQQLANKGVVRGAVRRPKRSRVHLDGTAVDAAAVADRGRELLQAEHLGRIPVHSTEFRPVPYTDTHALQQLSHDREV